MTENSFPGPMTMVQIDGATIKRLREEQGLTQLYLATAVEVTTDTISRWENKRYPSIKKENGIRLAEALGVALEELLDGGPDGAEETALPFEQEDIPDDAPQTSKQSSIKKVWPVVVLSTTLLTILLLFIYFYTQSTSQISLIAQRKVPPHATLGQSIPVVIKLTATGGDATSMILKEKLPAGTKVINITPGAANSLGKDRQIKWLGKIKTQAIYTYIFTFSGQSGVRQVTLSGTTAIANQTETDISGASVIEFGNFHWADSDRDNTINDMEILTVYDLFSEVTGLEDEIDLIEEIWLGSGYRWVGEGTGFQVIE
jgi:transcriptional regulator with XRE-family HTH domain